jgi:hypothetical protein
MLPFFNAALRQSTDSQKKRRPQTLAELTRDLGDVAQFSEHNASHKFWLSTPVFEALDFMSQSQGDTKSSWLRGFFAMHCYGTYTVTAMLRAHPKLFKDPDNSGILFSRADHSPPRGFVSQTTYFVPELGKNTAPVTVWIAQALKQDLTLLSDHAGITLSEYCREIVTARLLGHGTLPMRPEMLAASPHASLIAWENSEDAKLVYRRVSAKEYNNHPFGYKGSEWVAGTEAVEE